MPLSSVPLVSAVPFAVRVTPFGALTVNLILPLPATAFSITTPALSAKTSRFASCSRAFVNIEQISLSVLHLVPLYRLLTKYLSTLSNCSPVTPL